MFQKLKIHLILINIILLSIILILIFFGINFIIQLGIDKKSSLIMNYIAKEEFVFPFTETFFIRIDSKGNTIDYSPNTTVSTDEIEEVKKKVLSKEIQTGSISTRKYLLKFIKVPKNYGYIIVFLNYNIEKNIIKILIITSLCIGIISLILESLISHYLASKAMVPIHNSWEKQKTFIEDASHELRSPLTVLNSNIEIVVENEEDTVKSQLKWITNIQYEISRMTKLVEDLLFLARAGSEQIPMYQFNISDVLSQTYETFIPLTKKNDLNLMLDSKPNIIIYGNIGRIQQLLNILLDNAIKHTPSGGNIHLTLLSGENVVQLIVKDDGEGISNDNLDKIFEKFYTSRRQGGYGLGLSIAECIVNEHGGTIKVSSVLEKGTNFCITLPIIEIKKTKN